MIYELKCESCGKHDERYIRLVSYDKEIHKQKCEACGGHMVQVIRAPILKGLDSGPEGFLRGRVENDGCCDDFQRENLRRNAAAAGIGVEGKFYVAGLARPGMQEDPLALCSSRQEVLDKARALGVGVRGPGMDIEPRQSPPVEDDGIPSVDALKPTIIREVQERFNGSVTRKQYKKILEELQDKHRRKPPKPAKTITDTEFRNILKASKIVGE